MGDVRGETTEHKHSTAHPGMVLDQPSVELTIIARLCHDEVGESRECKYESESLVLFLSLVTKESLIA